MRPHQLILAALLLAAPAQAAPFLEGSWFGTGQPDDKSAMFLAHMEPGGVFRAEFRECIKGKAYDSRQSGTWTLAGDTEIVHVTLLDGLAISRTDTYTVLSHADGKQVYRYEGNGFVYTSHRVAADFKMPPCDLVS